MPKSNTIKYNGKNKGEKPSPIKDKKGNKQKQPNKSIICTIVPISIGQKYHETPKLENGLNQLLDHCPNSSFEFVSADSIQCYMLAIDNKSTPGEMRPKAIENGDTWRNKYANKIKANLFKNKKVNFSNWDDWTIDATFYNLEKKINDLYENNAEFRAAINADIDAFQKRRKKFFSDEEREYCITCLKQECAALLLWWYKFKPEVSTLNAQLKRIAIFYPQQVTKCIEFISDLHTDFILISVDIKSSNTNSESFYTHKVNTISNADNIANIPSLTPILPSLKIRG